MITMARSLCPGAWLRKPYYLQVGRQPPSHPLREHPAVRPAAPRGTRPRPAPFLPPWVCARPNPAAPCRQAPGGAPSPAPSAALPMPPTAALAPTAPRPAGLQGPGRPARVRPLTLRAPRRDLSTTRAPGAARSLAPLQAELDGPPSPWCFRGFPLSPVGPRRSAALDSVSWVLSRW